MNQYGMKVEDIHHNVESDEWSLGDVTVVKPVMKSAYGQAYIEATSVRCRGGEPLDTETIPVLVFIQKHILEVILKKERSNKGEDSDVDDR